MGWCRIWSRENHGKSGFDYWRRPQWATVRLGKLIYRDSYSREVVELLLPGMELQISLLRKFICTLTVRQYFVEHCFSQTITMSISNIFNRTLTAMDNVLVYPRLQCKCAVFFLVRPQDWYSVGLLNVHPGSCYLLGQCLLYGSIVKLCSALNVGIKRGNAWG